LTKIFSEGSAAFLVSETTRVVVVVVVSVVSAVVVVAVAGLETRGWYRH
jgi:hypothetical protein